MGVSAAGKTVVGTELARLIGSRFFDADDLHPAANVAKMAGGMPLDDEDRWPWLRRVGAALAESTGMVMACSALRRAHRDELRAAAPDVVFVHLTGSVDLLSARAVNRQGHFMPAHLLQSQLRALQPLDVDESGTEIDIDASVSEVAAAAATWIRSAWATSESL